MDFSQLLSVRQSTRKFKPDLPSPRIIQKILSAANHAPIGSNRYEDIHLTVVENQQKLLYLCEAAWKRFSSKEKLDEIAGDTASDAAPKKSIFFMTLRLSSLFPIAYRRRNQGLNGPMRRL